MEPPSPRLLQILRDLRLCTPSDLRRCRGHVRRLARDIPAFDSVWIDALLHLRKLTPYQARTLESDRPGDLRVGPCILTDRLGAGRFSTTWLARRLDGQQRCVLKVVTLPLDVLGQRLRAVEQVVQRLRGWSHPGIAGPVQALLHADRLVTLSMPVEGPHLGELLVRRGRFPAAVVQELAVQLIESLAALESRGVVHGDVSLRNVRISPNGQAILTDSGLQPALFPELTIHAGLAPDRYDNIAPELIGTGRTATTTSDVYALGCLLWNLLAGRPPFPTGDPLGKLAAHQTKVVSDVREWAPDTPAFLAEAILAFTRPNPQRRPRSFREILSRWNPGRMGKRRKVGAFVRQFAAPAPFAPTVAGAARSGFWPTVAAFLLLLSGLSLTLLDDHAKATLLSMPGEARHWMKHTLRTDGDPPLAATGERDLAEPPQNKPFPAPDARGVIELPDAGPWQAAEISSASALVLRGNPNKPAVILVAETPLQLWAEKVRLENVILQRDPNRTRRPTEDRPTDAAAIEQFLSVQCDRFELRACRIEEGQFDTESNEGSSVAAIAWRPLDVTSPGETSLLLQDSVIRTSGASLKLISAPAVIRVRNVLVTGHEPFLQVATPVAATRRLHIDAARLTLRGPQALLRLPSAAERSSGRVRLDMTDCVLSLSSAEAEVVQYSGRRVAERWAETLQIDGEGTLLTPGCDVAGLFSPDEKSVPLDTSDVDVGGLTAARFEFAGNDPATDLDSVVRIWNAPRRSTTPPGIDPTRFLGAKFRTALGTP